MRSLARERPPRVCAQSPGEMVLLNRLLRGRVVGTARTFRLWRLFLLLLDRRPLFASDPDIPTSLRAQFMQGHTMRQNFTFQFGTMGP